MKQKLFEKCGKLKKCIIDRNAFGVFIGSATVVYENPEDAKNAIQEYHGVYLDDKLLTVEYDTKAERIPKIRGANAI